MLDITRLLEDIKASPHEEIVIRAPHTGVVAFESCRPGDMVSGVSGEWKERPGTLLATLTRERNPKPVTAMQSGELRELHTELEGKFVEAGTPLAVVRHFLSREEVISMLLKHALHLFTAPERAKYYFTPAVDIKIKTGGSRSVTVHHGMELLIMSRMKRETPVYYTGPGGIIYTVYFKHNQNVDAGAPLLGVCPESQLAVVEELVLRVQTEWKERA
ncbi:MAG: biotin attachment protein [Desulfovibrionaceae bacterium]|nr:biotin attachment protein [Desulfovibrionaceae bacterium]MBO4793582.1 biotin attachment protein [Deltaproteobacteria bacterium]MBR5734392.1 biotin attachment protein [Desulfovibrionaceae bacterium]